MVKKKQGRSRDGFESTSVLATYPDRHGLESHRNWVRIFSLMELMNTFFVSELGMRLGSSVLSAND